MLIAGFLLLLQGSPADGEAAKLLSGVQSLLSDPVKNAEELDRRYLALKKLLDDNPDMKSREAVLSWMPRLARKTGRAAEALAAGQEVLKATKPDDPRKLEGWYWDAFYSAVLAQNAEAARALLKSAASSLPNSGFAKSKDALEADLKILGKSAPSISTPPADGSKFSWSAATKGKIVLVYLTASW